VTTAYKAVLSEDCKLQQVF